MVANSYTDAYIGYSIIFAILLNALQAVTYKQGITITLFHY